MFDNDSQKLPNVEHASQDWLEQSPVCTKILDLDCNLRYMSSAGVAALGIDDISAYYGTPFPFLFYPPSFKQALQEALERARVSGDVIELEGAAADVTGNEIWFQTTIIPIKDRAGEVEYLMVISIDINERKQLEEELRVSHTLFSQAEQLGKIGHWEWDVASDRLAACSEQYAAIFDMTVEEAMSAPEGSPQEALVAYEQDMLDYIHEDDRQRYNDVTEQAYERKQPWTIEFRIITEAGEVLDVLEMGEPQLNASGQLIRTFGILQDITHHKNTQQKLNYQASHDALTGLINRREFERRAERVLSHVDGPEQQHALCFMDLDQFKVVNDSCGHTAGDELLQQLGALLKKTVRQRDTLARLGGDEFGLLMEHCSIDDATRVVNTVLEAINSFQFSWDGKSFKVGVSIGLTMINETTGSLSELMRDADAACYVAKEEGRNRVHVHHAGDVEMARRHGEMQWVTRLNHALEKDRLCLYAQSICALNAKPGVHYEVLLRLLEDNGDTIPPGAFLPAAERYNLSIALDTWVLQHCLKLLLQQPKFLQSTEFISINLSGPSLADEKFLSFAQQCIKESGIAPTKLCFEITETAAISNLSRATAFIGSLRDIGCRFALDDFGSGLSSFGYLKNLPVDYLKIDGMFVRDIAHNPIDRAMVKSINEIGQVMGMQTIAEFVENDAIRQMLEGIGVNYAQGYGIGKPQPLIDLMKAV